VFVMAHRLLMCPPHSTDSPEARRQWDRFVELLRAVADVRIELIDPSSLGADLAFTSQAALVIGDLAVIASAREPYDRVTRRIFRSTLARLGFATTLLHEAAFAGSADALYDRMRPIVYVGYGPASDRFATYQLGEFLSSRVVPLGLADPRFPHLDTVLTPLRRGHVLTYMPGLVPHAQRLLRRLVEPEYLIEISAADAAELACNALELDDAVFVHAASRALRDRLVGAGYGVFSSDLGEFVRRGGGAKRLTLKLDDGPAAAGAAA
jgi:N-dimethylarginine dimethylaminohydrolase